MSLRMTKAVWKCSKAKGPARLVLLALADHADEEGRAWPSAARLARYTLMDVRNVHRALAKLVEQGEIIPVGKGKRGVIVYGLTPGNQPEPMAKSPEVERTDLWRNRHRSNSSEDDLGMEPVAKSSGAPLAKSPDKQSIEPSLEPPIAAAAKQAVELFNSLAEELGLRPVQRLTENRRAQLISRLADTGGIAEKSKQRVAQLRAQVAEVRNTIARLEAERDRLQRRRDDASAIVCACRQLLMERGLSRTELKA